MREVRVRRVHRSAILQLNFTKSEGVYSTDSHLSHSLTSLTSLTLSLSIMQLAYCSFIVPDLDAAVQFFTTSLGFEVLSEEGPISDSGDRITRQYAMPDKAIGRSTLLGQKGQQLELREWEVYGQGLNPLRESTVPGCSIAIRVPDFERTLEQLKQIPRMRLLEVNYEQGFVYCFTPFGVQLQLLRSEGFGV